MRTTPQNCAMQPVGMVKEGHDSDSDVSERNQAV